MTGEIGCCTQRCGDQGETCCMAVNGMNPAVESEIEKYLKTGDHDQYYRAWPEG
jgi:hypothetical protein